MKKFKIDWLILPLLGVVCVLLAWSFSSATWAHELPSPSKTWEKSKEYVLKPFEKRGEMDQGILRFTWYSLALVAKGYAIALLVGTPLGFMLGLSPTFSKTFDPIIQVLRPVSPLAWLPLGLVLFLSAGKQASELGALFTIGLCAMWPTVLNTAVGVRAVPQDFLNVAKVLKLSRTKTLFKILLPAALPQILTGLQVALPIALIVVVVTEMQMGGYGLGGAMMQASRFANSPGVFAGIVEIAVIGYALVAAMAWLRRRLLAWHQETQGPTGV